MKSDRLLSILLLLQTRGRVRAGELAERLEVSVRTIYRDVESLSAAGVPVYAERGRYGGIALLPGFRTDVTGLTSDESRALFVLAAQSAHSALGLDKALGSALRKVMAALPAPHRPAAELTSRRILVDPDRWLAHGRRGPDSRTGGAGSAATGTGAGAGGTGSDGAAVDLDVLHTAVFADRRLRIRYRHSGERERRTYTVDPYGLVAKAGTWYLVADRRGRPRLFRADRVAAATVTDAPVRRRDGVELADAWEVLRREVERRPEGVRVRARVRRERLDMFTRLAGSDLAAVLPEEGGGRGDGGGGDDGGGGGWVGVEMAYPVLRAVRQLLQFGTDVRVLGPSEARTELARAVAELHALYGQGASDAEESGKADGAGAG
ncbi:WYL domain-containing protein [Streptomyces sp. Z26]|uniref:helix-turn-helix transcriptional regulator n=1 Tax=Streptomyces sp. Z26 TaxID=2500177 RepID=UPI000EF173A9|nr:WYL domain-containing protein [Streptomyces sp. Z26]RLL68702.1 WYL domain-containing protein [Streptomyces sp. Z26]